MAYEDGFSEPRWLRLLRKLEASLRLGRWFGVEVRIYWLALLIPLIGVPELMRAGFGFPAALGLSALGTGPLYLVIYTHEMGHIAAGWRYGVPTRLITLSPLGGIAHMGAQCPSPRAEVVVTAAGPAVHLVWLALVWPLSWLLENRAADLPYAAWLALGLLETMNVSLLLFNLLPCFPMDGGRILRALLAMRLHPNRASIIAAKVGLFGAAGFVVAGLFTHGFWGAILVAIGLTNAVACWHELRAARFSEGPYGTSGLLEPWQADPEAWKAGGAPEAAGEREARSPVAGWLGKRRAGRARKERGPEREADLDREVDRILERVSEVGLAGLTEDERATLDAASRIKRARQGRR